MAAAVSFDYPSWVARYPEFSLVTEPTAAAYFDEAGMYWANDGSSRASTTVIQSLLMNMVTAHLAAIYSQSQGDPTPGAAKDANAPAGRVASATEGSVSVQLQNDYPPGSPQWFQQTKYGASFWAATAQYRTMRFARGRLQSGAQGIPGVPGQRNWWTP